MADHAGPSEVESSELVNDLSQTLETLFSAGGVKATLQSIVALAVETIDGCDFAGIFMMVDDEVVTAAYTDQIVIEIDALQHHFGEGPCLDAIAGSGVTFVDELADDDRWPAFGPPAHAAGIRSAMAIHLSVATTDGALNTYARFPRAFGIVDRARGIILAQIAGYALASAQTHENEEARIRMIQAGLVTREMIGRAEGILMERERITSDQAFDVLRRASQHLNVKLRDVAQRLVDTGERPETD